MRAFNELFFECNMLDLTKDYLQEIIFALFF